MTNQTAQLVTRSIAGHDVTLTAGEWYIASRPMAQRGRTNYPISIEDAQGATVATIAPMTYDEANSFINAFNNGALSFDGRTW